jgi:hypothetical protein
MFVKVKPLSAFTPEAAEYWTRQMAVAWESMSNALLRLWFKRPPFDGQAGQWRRRRPEPVRPATLCHRRRIRFP